MAKREKTTIKDWLIVLVALLDDAVILVLLLLALWFFKIDIPLWVTIILAVLLGTFTFIISKAIIPSLHRQKTVGAEAMIGLEGEVVESLVPRGVVKVGGEYWQAKSAEEDITVGEEVEVLGLSRLMLEVRRKHQ